MTKFFIPENRSFATAWSTVASRIGATISEDLDECEYILPCSNYSAWMVANGTRNLNFMSLTAFDTLTSRMGAQAAGFPSIPTIYPLTANAMSSMAGPIFVKANYTITKKDNAVAYTTWPSAAAFIASVDSSFWDYQVASVGTKAGYVVQPALVGLTDIIALHVAVNKQSQILAYRTHHEQQSATNVYARTDSVARRLDLESIVQSACGTYGVKGGLHHIQFVEYNNTWVLMDWNPRPTEKTSIRRALTPGFADEGLAFMLGLPYSGPTLPNYQCIFPE